MTLRIREIIIRAEVTPSSEDARAASTETGKGRQDKPGEESLTTRFFKDDHAQKNER